MAEYIKREDAIDLFWTVDTENNGDDGYTVVIKFGRCYDSNEIEALLSKLPAADVAEVRNGRWEFLGPNRLIKNCMCGTCSACHVRSKYIVNTAICPNCGALMKEAANEVSEP